MSTPRRALRAVVASALTLAAGGGIALADDLVADGDLVALGAQQLSFGNVCVNTSTSKPVALAIVKSQGGTNSFANVSSVTVSRTGLAGGGLTSPINVGTIGLTGWSGVPNGTTSAPVFATATLNRSVTGHFSGSITFTASGTFTNPNNNNTGSLTRSVTVNVTANVIACDTTPPTLNLPAPITAEATSAAGAAVSFTATASDTAPASPTVTCQRVSGSTFPLGTTEVSCSASDDAGNTATGSFFVTVHDTTPPSIANAPANVTVEAQNDQGATVTFTAPTASDLVDGPVAIACTPSSGATFPLGTSNVSCSAADSRGNAASTTFAVTVSDTTAPVLLVPAPLVAEATSPAGAAVAFTTSATDAVSGALMPTCTPPSGATFVLGASTVSCIATDDAGNSATASFAVEVVDTTPPAIGVPASFSTEATSAAGAVVAFASSATDLVGGSLATSCSPHDGSILALGPTTITCAATDAAGNTGTASFVVSVVDTTGPALSLPADVSEEAGGPTGNQINYTASATDLVDPAVPVSCVPVSGGVFPVGTTTVECTATDDAGNTSMGSFTVEINDTIAPTITVPTVPYVEAVGPGGAPVTFEVTAYDTVDEVVVASCDAEPGDTFPLGTTTVTCTAEDEAGNVATDAFDVTVVDTTKPTITGGPGNLTIEADRPEGAIVSFDDPTATDIVSGEVDVDCIPPSESLFLIDVATEVVCSATDNAGNTASATFVITVDDTTAPLLSLPTVVTAEATSPAGGIATYEVTSTDAVDVVVPVLCDPPSGALYGLGETDVACSATDTHDNRAVGSFIVAIVDTTAPVIEVPTISPIEATGPAGAVVTYTVTATDLVDTDVTIECDLPSGGTFGIGDHSVTCTATDDFDNDSDGVFTVTVQDKTAPALTVPGDITVEAAGAAGTAVTFTTSALDIVDGAVVPSCSWTSGATFPLGTTTISCTATDLRNNSETDTFTVTVQDTTPPTVTVPGNVTAEATSAAGAVVAFITSATDIVDGTVGVTCSPSSGSTFGIATTVVSCTATDAAGNTGDESFTVTVQDTTGPVIDGTPADILAEATSSAGAEVVYVDPSAVDVVDGGVAVSCVPPSGSTFALDEDTTVTCTATDSRGNTTTDSFVISVADRTAPVLIVPNAMTVEATGSDGAVATFAPTADDTVDGDAPVSCTPSSGSLLAIGAHDVHCTAVDAHGNGASASFTVTVVDTTAPTVTVPATINLEATGPAGAAATFTVSASDIVDGAIAASCNRVSGSTFAIGTTTVTCTATDAHGNTGTASFDVVVADTTAPTLSLPANISVIATGPFNHDNPDDGDDNHPDHNGHYADGYWYRGRFHGRHDHGTTTTSFQAGAIVQFDATATDLVDGAVPVTCTPPSGSLFAVGTTTVSCSATDAHGNVGTGSFTVNVRFELRGFLSPVDPSTVNVVKGGSTVPLKFQVLTASGQPVANPSVVTGYTVAKIACGTANVQSTATYTTSERNGLKYGRDAKQFVLNWQTPKTPGACYRVDVNLVGGQSLSASFQMK